MGCTPEAIDAFIEHKMMYAPGKAVNAGGVATSGLVKRLTISFTTGFMK